MLNTSKATFGRKRKTMLQTLVIATGVLTLNAAANGVGTNNCLNLSVRGDYMEIPNCAAIDFKGAFSIESWVLLTAENDALAIYKRGNHNSGFGCSVSTAMITAPIFGHFDTYAKIPTPLNQWVHLAVVFDGSKMSLYRDGALVKSRTGERGVRSTTSNVLVGASVNSDGTIRDYYTGTCDELRIWNKALTERDIKDNFNRELTGSEPGLVAYYNFDELLIDGRVKDLTANGNHGLLRGRPELGTSGVPLIRPAPQTDGRDTAITKAEYVGLQNGNDGVAPQRPADLSIDSVTFVEPSGNKALDGYEPGQIRLVMANRGFGEAQNIEVTLSPLGESAGLEFDKTFTIKRIEPHSNFTLTIQITANRSVTSLPRSIRIQASEEFGFDAAPVVLNFETVAYNPPDLQIPKVAINDSQEGEKGEAYGNGNSIIESGESVVVTAFVQNFGAGPSEQTMARVRLKSDSPYLFCPDTSRVIDFGNIEAGDYREVKFFFFSAIRYSSEAIPIFIELTEAKGDFGKTLDLGLKMNVRTENIVDVSIARVATPKPVVKEIAGFGKSDVDAVPARSQTIRPNGLAVVIGIQDYKYAPIATYASRDAEAFYNYAVQVLGIPDANIYYSVNDGATVGEFMKLFDEGGWLSRRVTPESEVFVFYSGHGAPDLASKNPYLIPYDVDPNYANKGYSALVLYENLGKLGAKSATVMLDACFSGQDREDKMLLADARPVRMSVGVGGIPDNVTVLSASSGDEISSSYPEQRHGIFSYYLMKGLGGTADSDANGQVTVQELYDFVNSSVKKTAGSMDRLQTPQIVGRTSDLPLVTF